AAAGLAAYTVAAKLAAPATAALSTAFPAFLAITAGIAAIAGVVAYLSDYSSAAEEAAAETVNLQEQFAELQSGIEHDNHIISLCEDYKKLTKQSDYAIDNLKDMEGFSDLKISAVADATIDPNDFLLDNDVKISGDPMGNMDADLLLDEDGNIVQIDGAAGEVIAASDLVDGEPVSIDGQAGAQIDDDDLVKKTGIVLTATGPDDEHKLEASAFVNGQLIEFTASWANRSEFEEDVENLKKQAEIAKKDLTEAQTVYDHLKEYRDQLLSRKKFAGSESEKDSLSAQLAEVNEQITAQEEELGRLQTAYEEAGGRYVIAANAAGTLAEKEQRLAAIQAELGVSSDGIADNIDDQTTAIWGQVDAIEAETRALREQKRIEFYNNVGSQSMTYWRKAVGASSNNEISPSYRSVGGAQQYAQFASEMANYAGTFNGKSVAEYNQELSNVTHRLDDYYAHGNTNSPAFAEDVKKLYALRMMRSTGDVTFDAQVNRPNGYKTFATEGTDAWLKSIGADQAGFSFVNTFNTPQVGDSLSGGIAAAYQVSRDAQTWYEEIQAEQDAYIQSLVDSVSQGAISIEDCDKAV
ncbi:MAG: hypothetical protein J6X24_04120, partial [Firmicutes bacterium]|nr:hypothetical protein [Bacillota bacterium]